MRLLPRDVKFFEYFLKQADLLDDAAQVLASSLASGGPALIAGAAQIAEIEKKADLIIHETFVHLNKTFITPIDPEDIHVLATYLDDVIDGLEEVSHRVAAYHIDPVPPRAVEAGKRLLECAGEIKKAFQALAKDQPVISHCVRINRLEEEVDELTRAALSELFDEEKDAIRLIKLKEVYESIEQTADDASNVSDALQEVSVKNS
jgi:uncharacterized protein Yka (UPF0111/DUF47 family)